jgi:heme exporter protein D
MAGVAILLILFCVGAFAVLAWFAVTITSEGGVKKVVNSVTSQRHSIGGSVARKNRDIDSSGGFDILDPIDSIYSSNMYHHND